MSDCIFCKIAKGELTTDKVYEDTEIVAFEDRDPQAPVHILIIPKKHIATVNDLEEEDEKLIGKIYLAAKKIAADKGIADEGYRVVVNCNKKAGQAVFHLHFHLLGGRDMQWPPG